MTGTFANMLCPWFFGTVLLLGLPPTSGAAPTQAATGARVGHAIAHEKNCSAWAYSPGNGHVSSKGFVELFKRLFEGPLRGATVRQ